MTHPVTLTVTFPSFDAAAAFLAGQQPPVIAADDRPDVGVDRGEPASVPAPPALSNPFAVAEVAAVPAAPTAPSPSPAPSAAPSPDSAPVATAAVPPATVELDSSGLPWDGRIHGTTKTKNGDGTWRQKRGLNDPALKTRVEAELRAGQAARVPPPPTAAATAPVASSAPAVESTPATPAPTLSGETFGQLMARLAPVTMGDPAKAAKLNEALAAFQLTSLAQLAARPDLVAPFAQTADAMLA